MSYKPSEVELIDYLYGQLDKEKKDEIEEYLSNHPEERNKLKELEDIRNIMGKLGDKEVIEPQGILDEGKLSSTSWYSTGWLKIAASILLLLTIGWLSGARITFSDEPNSISEAEIQQLIDRSLDKNNHQLISELGKLQKSIEHKIDNGQRVQKKEITQLVDQQMQTNELRIGNHLIQLQSTNEEAIRDYFELSSEEQQAYLQTMLTDFATYMQEVRYNDRLYYQARLDNIEQGTDQLQLETEQIFASIFASNTQNK